MLAAFLQNDCQFEFVIQFLRQMLGINDRLVGADDGVHVLKENDPGHYGMREAGLGSFFMVLAEISGRVKELLRDDRRLQLNFIELVYKRLARRPFFGCFGIIVRKMGNIIKSFASGIEAGVAALE